MAIREGIGQDLVDGGLALPVVDVFVAVPVPGPFSYLWPFASAPAPGVVVEVPFGPRRALGIVRGPSPCPPAGGEKSLRLKAVARLLPAPTLKPALLQFIDFLARYNCVSEGMIARLVLRVPDALEAPPLTRVVRAAAGAKWPERLTAARQRVRACLEDGLARTPAELAHECSVSGSVVKGLVEAGLLEWLERPADPEPAVPRLLAPLDLSPPQQSAAEAIGAAIRAARHETFLLDGVTGSGKTEVYFAAIGEALDAGGQALVLLPEIALTGQFLERFERRFGCRPGEWHSDVPQTERRRTWAAVQAGRQRVVIGARSALFLPFDRLRLIVVDEEHDGSYKQEEGVTYHARDMAVVRARFEGCPLVLASATPSLETDQNARAGRYRRLVLPNRHGSAVLPAVEAVDLRTEEPARGRFLAPRLLSAMAETIAAGEQVLLYLNRRGYAPLTLCRACGHRLMSPEASSWLVEHRFHRRLVCHVTGFSMPKPDACPACGVADSLVPCGPGVERIEEEVRERFPEARIGVASSDLVHGPSQTQAFFAAMERGETDILIGTQIVAKGHHFPGLTLVGVVDADLGLAGGDLRAAERTFQLLHQVGGRAGRAGRPGRVCIQTRMPEHPVIGALVSGGRDDFLETEAAAREAAGMPPFGRLAAVIIAGGAEGEAIAAGRALIAAAPSNPHVTIWGPAVAPIAVVRGRHRARLLVKAPRNFNLSGYMGQWLADAKVPSSVRLQVDIDPMSFL